MLAEQCRPCFDSHVGLRGRASAAARIDTVEYAAQRATQVERFLRGSIARSSWTSSRPRCKTPRPTSTSSVRAASSARIDTINALDRQASRRCFPPARAWTPTWSASFARRPSAPACTCFVVREGRVINSNEFILNQRPRRAARRNLLRDFLLRYYDDDLGHPRTRCAFPASCPRRRGAGGVARARSVEHLRRESALHGPAERGEKRRLLDMAVRQRAPRPHALHGAHGLRG